VTDRDFLKILDAPEVAVLANCPQVEAGHAEVLPHLRIPMVEAPEVDGMVAALPRRHRNVPRMWCESHKNGEDGKMKDTIIGVDLAKEGFFRSMVHRSRGR
jgi:hypothetical protein